jgi:hypothetical protein
MNKKKRAIRKLSIRIGIIIAILAGGYIALITLVDRAGPIRYAGNDLSADGFIFHGEPVIETVARWHLEENLDQDAINRQLAGAFEVVLLDEDINANSDPNYLVISIDGQLPGLASYLSDAGYTHVFRKLKVYEVRNRSLYPILHIDREAIRDEFGARLIDQVPARYGYGLLVDTYEHEVLYEKPVQLIEIVMLDDEGEAVSDDIVIYWDTGRRTFKATNTFGAP